MQNRLLIIGFVFLISLSFNTFAQKTIVYNNPNVIYNEALNLYNKEKYTDAQQYFSKALEIKNKDFFFDRANAEYYHARCAMFLFNRDADYLIRKFISKHPESRFHQEAIFEMARFQYQKKKYRKAYKWFAQVDKYLLTNEQLIEYNFKYGYSLYIKSKLDEASFHFYEIIDSTESEYNSPAIYYYGHICYEQKKYETALIQFKKLVDDDLFAPIVPYYITQILYIQSKYDDIISYAPGLIDAVSEKRYPEIARILGEAYYKKERYKEAIPYLEIYRDKGLDYGRDDKYELAYSYYKTGNYENAIKNFKGVLYPKDELAQKAYIAMADCFLKTNDKPGARTAFYEASKINVDKKTSIDAMFNYAKLSYELSDSPFNDAIKAFTAFIKKYPESPRTDEAYVYLSKVYLTTKNYQAAIESYEQIKNITKEIEIAYQRITFFRGIELLKNRGYRAAIQNFNKSINNSSFDKTIKARAWYWKAQSYYKLKRYNDAESSYNKFITTPGAYLLPEYMNAHYDLGYCYFKQKDYKNSANWFRKFSDMNSDKTSEMMNDANIRIGDCLFMQKKYQFAVDFYNKAIEINKRNTDYALFQKGFSLGLLKDYNNKIIVLSTLINDYSKSIYCDDAVYEIGNSYFAMENNDMAISTFTQLVDDYPSSPYIPKTYLKLGLLYLNKDQPEAALAAYKAVTEKYPNSPQAKPAVDLIKNIYTNDLADVDGFIKYTKDADININITETQEDSLTYRTAEKLYMRGDYDKSKELFANYINKFPKGKYLLNANFYKAECNFQAGEESEALESYTYVASQEKSEFTEEALLKATNIAYTQGKYKEAINLYKKLIKYADNKSNIAKANVGIMRSYYNLKDYDNSVKSAINVLKNPDISDNMYREAHYTIACSFYKKKNYKAAFDEYQLLAEDVTTNEGAEAKYRLAEIYMKNGELDDAEAEINDFRTQNTSNKYWLAKAYILWADIFKAKNDYFYATATLQSIIDNYGNKSDGIVEEATNKLVSFEDEMEEDEDLDEAASENVLQEINEIDNLIDDDSTIKKEEKKPTVLGTEKKPNEEPKVKVE